MIKFFIFVAIPVIVNTIKYHWKLWICRDFNRYIFTVAADGRLNYRKKSMIPCSCPQNRFQNRNRGAGIFKHVKFCNTIAELNQW